MASEAATESNNPFEGFESLGKKKKEKLLKKVLRESGVGNLEKCKRVFLNVSDADYTDFRTELKDGGYKLYTAQYPLASDYNGRPTFVLGNVISGFTQQMESDARYFFVHFTCTKNKAYDKDDNTSSQYLFTSYWISGTNLDIATYQKYYNEYFSNFTFEEVTDVASFLTSFEHGHTVNCFRKAQMKAKLEFKAKKKAEKEAAKTNTNDDSGSDSDSNDDSDSSDDESDSESEYEMIEIATDLLHSLYFH